MNRGHHTMSLSPCVCHYCVLVCCSWRSCRTSWRSVRRRWSRPRRSSTPVSQTWTATTPSTSRTWDRWAHGNWHIYSLSVRAFEITYGPTTGGKLSNVITKMSFGPIRRMNGLCAASYTHMQRLTWHAFRHLSEHWTSFQPFHRYFNYTSSLAMGETIIFFWPF